MKRILSLFLALLMLVSAAPVTALAMEESVFGGGTSEPGVEALPSVVQGSEASAAHETEVQLLPTTEVSVMPLGGLDEPVASDYVAVVTGEELEQDTYFTSLTEAIGWAGDGAGRGASGLTVKMLCDYEERIVLSTRGPNAVTLDLNGYSLKEGVDVSYCTEEVPLTIINSDMILDMENGQHTGTGGIFKDIRCSSSALVLGEGLLIDNDAENCAAVYVDWVNSTEGPSTVTINGAYLTAAEGMEIYDNSTVTFKSGYIGGCVNVRGAAFHMPADSTGVIMSPENAVLARENSTFIMEGGEAYHDDTANTDWAAIDIRGSYAQISGGKAGHLTNYDNRAVEISPEIDYETGTIIRAGHLGISGTAYVTGLVSVTGPTNVEITGGTIYATYEPIMVNRYEHEQGPVVIVTGGTLEIERGYGYYWTRNPKTTFRIDPQAVTYKTEGQVSPIVQYNMQFAPGALVVFLDTLPENASQEFTVGQTGTFAVLPPELGTLDPYLCDVQCFIDWEPIPCHLEYEATFGNLMVVADQTGSGDDDDDPVDYPSADELQLNVFLPENINPDEPIDFADLHSPDGFWLELSAEAFCDGGEGPQPWQEFWWDSSDDDVVGNNGDGWFYIHRPGKVTLTAGTLDGSELKASMDLEFYYADTAEEIEVKATLAGTDTPAERLTVGSKVDLRTYGDKLLDFDNVYYQLTGGDGADVEMDHDTSTLIIHNVTKPTTLTVTAMVCQWGQSYQYDEQTGEIILDENGEPILIDVVWSDPLGRTAEVEFDLLPARIEEFRVFHGETLVNGPDAASVILNSGSEEEIPLIVEANTNIAPNDYTPVTSGMVSLKSSNTKLANAYFDEEERLVVWAVPGADGVCTIDIVANDTGKAETSITVEVRDYTPRLSTNKVTLNTALEGASVEVPLVMPYGTELFRPFLADDDNDQIPGIIFGDRPGVLTITATEPLENQTIKGYLMAGVTGGDLGDTTTPIKLPLTITIKNSVPKVTVKQDIKINQFFTDSQAILTLTSKEGAVTNAWLDTTNLVFAAPEENFDPATGELTFGFSDALVEEYKAAVAAGMKIPKLNTKATLMVKVEGYRAIPVTVTVKIEKKAPAYVPTLTASTIDPNYTAEVSFGVVEKKTGEVLTFTSEELRLANTVVGAEHAVTDGTITLTQTDDDVKSNKVDMLLQLANWMEPVKLTHKITLKEVPKPTAKVTGKLTLSNVFTGLTATAQLTLSANNLTLQAIEDIAPSPKNKNLDEAAKIKVSMDANGVITASIPGEAPAKGSYTFDIQPVVDGFEGDIKPVSVKVTVEDKQPKVKLSATSVKLNNVLVMDLDDEVKFGDIEQLTATVDSGYTVHSFMVDGKDLLADAAVVNGVSLSVVEGELVLICWPEYAPVGKSTVELIPVVKMDGNDTPIPLTKPIKLSIQVYEKDDLSVTVTTKGKLDMIDRTSYLECTVSKINNMAGDALDVALVESEAANKFYIPEDSITTNAKGQLTFKLMLKEGEAYDPKASYELDFNVTVGYSGSAGLEEGIPAYVATTAKSVKVKVSESKPKVEVAPKSHTIYLSQGNLATTFVLDITKPVNASIASMVVNAKTKAEVLGAVDCILDDKNGTVSLRLTDDARANLQAGKSYTVLVDVLAEGHSANAKPVQVKLNFKVQN